MDAIPDRDADQAQFQADLAALLAHPPVLVVIRPGDLWFLVTAAQLALRHPQFPPLIRQAVVDLVDRLEPYLGMTPALLETLRAGWDPGRDVPFAGTSPREEG